MVHQEQMDHFKALQYQFLELNAVLQVGRKWKAKSILRTSHPLYFIHNIHKLKVQQAEYQTY